MRDNYFTNAIIPAAVKLRETWPKYQYLSDELDLMFDSSACIMTMAKTDGKLVGAKLSTVWTVDKDYDAFPINALDWLNISSEIAIGQVSH